MITRSMVELLGCPACFGEALTLQDAADLAETGRIESGRLSCPSCQCDFPIEHGVPDLIPTGKFTGSGWQFWKDHLEGYDARRQRYRKQRNPLQARRWKEKQEAFLRFMSPPPGNLLDIGCGSGSLRTGLDMQRITYFGIDPLPTPRVNDFFFARAVAEALPFRRDTFSSIVIRSALDHFCELDAFFAEAKRVLTPDGHFYVEQSVHDRQGVKAVPKILAHAAKDCLDNWKNRGRKSDAPKHMKEYTRQRLLDTFRGRFEVLKTQEYNRNWYTATQMFLLLKA